MSTTAAVRPAIYVVFGRPGAGKGTFGQALQAEGYDPLSTGDITREEVKKETEFGKKYQDAILNHTIGGIPFEEIQNLVEKRLNKALAAQKGVILDGYPKTLEQCELLDRFIQNNALKDKVVFVLLDVNEEKALERIAYRQTCGKCNKIYNAQFSPSQIPDVCDACQAVLTKRIDDDPERTKKRVCGFENQMLPVIAYYQRDERLQVLDVNGAPAVCVEQFLTFHRSQLGVKV